MSIEDKINTPPSAESELNEVQHTQEQVAKLANLAIGEINRMSDEAVVVPESILEEVTSLGGDVNQMKDLITPIDEAIILASSSAKIVLQEWVKLENHEFDEKSFFRIVNSDGFKDFLQHGVVRASPEGTPSSKHGRFDLGGRTTNFPSFADKKPDSSYMTPKEDNYIFESNTPMIKRGEINPVTGKEVRGRHWAARPIDPVTGEVVAEMPPHMIKNIYKVDAKGDVFTSDLKKTETPVADKD